MNNIEADSTWKKRNKSKKLHRVKKHNLLRHAGYTSLKIHFTTYSRLLFLREFVALSHYLVAYLFRRIYTSSFCTIGTELVSLRAIFFRNKHKIAPLSVGEVRE
ncbi:hypothetical protein COU88_03195 [Candidatus Roizmanbacteria bacterium CG10_big_fil_rev_8_21_14_0_10_39_6]|uniref:Uncharacterized protein n=1 Tax=Candidatus Roizmanbacteria bacterium CG10_big_fil_rev_8_21_14_0_10_39_6 TaxID=1974853 RepID=A0A2M8KSA1_9BACT|nr:MAG: hypothetical protein COU88_03195 [Candidatus Roizmanbacteria bacterium CG10_big_fil_rev_8_21_14_0_10_39_6]